MTPEVTTCAMHHVSAFDETSRRRLVEVDFTSECCITGTVGSEITEGATSRHTRVHAADRRAVTEALGQAVGLHRPLIAESLVGRDIENGDTRHPYLVPGTATARFREYETATSLAKGVDPEESEVAHCRRAKLGTSDRCRHGSGARDDATRVPVRAVT